MRVRMLVSQVGPRTNRKPGHEYDMNDAEAVRCINAGIAEMIKPEGKVEKKEAPKAPEYRKTARKGSKRS